MNWQQPRVVDMHPPPLASNVHAPPDGWEVEIVVILETTGVGYSSSPRADGQERSGGPAEADRVRRAGPSAFAVRLRDSLA